MIGYIQKLLVDLATAAGGPAAAAEVLRRAGVPPDRQYRLDQVYPDEEWHRLLAAACEVLKVTPAQAEEAYADFFCKDALQRFPVWFRISRNSREFIERQPAIHGMFAAALRDPAERQAIYDKFRIEQADGGIVTHYQSPNRHCGLYIAIATWIVRHYGDEAAIQELRCAKQGAPECEIRITWQRLAGAPA